MKIHGVEGMSPEMLRDEVGRGGRFVIYTYCVSILVMTFKRGTDVYYIKPGRSTVAGSLPFVAVSFLFGWWGVPWGPIYTIQAIYQNLAGGIDVTDDLIRQFAPAPAGATPAHATHSPAQPPGPGTAKTPEVSFNYRVAAMMVLAVCVAALIGISGYCYYKQTHMGVVLVSGLPTPYTVMLNGEPHTLQPFGAEVLTMSEGEFTIEDAPGSTVVGAARQTTFSSPFLDHLGKEKLAVINPDGVAILLRVEVNYYRDDPLAHKDDKVNHDLLANRWSHYIDRPDYVLEDAPGEIEMSAGTQRAVKHRLENVPQPDIGWAFDQIKEFEGYPAARDYLMRVAKWRTDEDLLLAAAIVLTPGDVPAFFALHLDDRPIPIEWHRYYQQRMSTIDPDFDLVAEYRARLETEPGNGVLCYLLARIVPDGEEQDRLWQRALSADPPCNYAYNALGYNALTECRFDDAVECFRKSTEAGISSKSLAHSRRQALLGAGKIDDALAEISSERRVRPLDLMLAEEEINFTFAAKHDFEAVARIRDDYMRSYRRLNPPAEYLENAELMLGVAVANLSDDQDAFARSLSRLSFPYYQFRGALLNGDLDTATQIAAETFAADTSAHLLLFLLADRKSDAAAADASFGNAVSSMTRGSPDERTVARELATERPDAAAICRAHIDVGTKRILLTALGLRFPADREVYFATARRLNFEPQFPQRFLKVSLDPPAATRL